MDWKHLFVQENAYFLNILHFLERRDHSNDCAFDNFGGEGIYWNYSAIQIDCSLASIN
jgi:hypothetical protein